MIISILIGSEWAGSAFRDRYDSLDKVRRVFGRVHPIYSAGNRKNIPIRKVLAIALDHLEAVIHSQILLLHSLVVVVAEA